MAIPGCKAKKKGSVKCRVELRKPRIGMASGAKSAARALEGLEFLSSAPNLGISASVALRLRFQCA